MKSIEEIKQHEPILLADWEHSKLENVIASFEYDKRDIEYKDEKNIDIEGINILLAYYLYEDYNGEAFVLFEKNNELYEVNGSHCSCYALEGQWKPELTDLNALKYRLEDGTLGLGYTYSSEERDNIFNKELKELLGIN